MCQRSSSSTRSTPSRTPGSAPSSRSASSARCPAEDDPLEHHVVEAMPSPSAGAALRDLGSHRGQPLLEELEHPAGACSRAAVAPLVRRVSGQLEHLGGDAVEEHRVALLVTALQEEDPRHEPRIVGGVAERREVLGDGVLGDAEAGEERGEAVAALVRETGPRRGVGCEVDRLRVPLQPGHDPGEEVRPAARRAAGSQAPTSSWRKRRPVAGSKARSHACRSAMAAR